MKQAGNRIIFYPVHDAAHELWFNPGYREVSGKVKADFLKQLGYL
jgi:hypothetical protein